METLKTFSSPMRSQPAHAKTSEQAAAPAEQPAGEPRLATAQPDTIQLGAVAHTRSGDKGNHANLGVIAYTPVGYQFLCAELTAERVAHYFAGLGASRVERFELPGIGALNFMLYDCLAGGASRSLRIDTQGKLLGTAALELPLPRPAELAQMERRQP